MLLRETELVTGEYLFQGFLSGESHPMEIVINSDRFAGFVMAHADMETVRRSFICT